MALSMRIKSLERAESQTCDHCSSWPDEQVLRVRLRIVGPGDMMSRRQEVSPGCPRCGRKIKIKRIEVECTGATP
jgi:hypothetical protein